MPRDGIERRETVAGRAAQRVGAADDRGIAEARCDQAPLAKTLALDEQAVAMV